MAMSRKLWAGFVMAALLASAAYAKQGTVKTRDGQTYEGDVTEQGDDYVVKSVKGIVTRIPRDTVAGVEYERDIEPEVREKLAKLAKNDVAGRVALANTAYQARRYDLARDLLTEALAIDPNDAKAAELYEAVRSQLELQRRAGAGGARPGGGEAAPKAARVGEPVPADVVAGEGDKYLSAVQINQVKQAEIQTGDTGVAFRFENDVEKRYAAQHAMTLAQFRAMTPLEKFLAIRASGDPALLVDVQVVRDPVSLVEFRRSVQPLVLAGCASAGCHNGGGGPAGAFSLRTPANNDAATYTNYYLLSVYAKAVKESGGVFKGSPSRAMINRVQPQESLLTQFGLPAALAMYPHPEVAGYKGVYRTADDPRLAGVTRWIRSLNPLKPEYGFRFGQPAATSAPAAPAAPVNPPGTATKPAGGAR